MLTSQFELLEFAVWLMLLSNCIIKINKFLAPLLVLRGSIFIGWNDDYDEDDNDDDEDDDDDDDDDDGGGGGDCGDDDEEEVATIMRGL